MSLYKRCGECGKEYKNLYDHQRIRCPTVAAQLEEIKQLKKENEQLYRLQQRNCMLQAEIKTLAYETTRQHQEIYELRDQIFSLQRERKTVINNTVVNNYIIVDQDMMEFCQAMKNYQVQSRLENADFENLFSHMKCNAVIEPSYIEYINCLNNYHNKRQKIAHYYDTKLRNS